jgi:hypothetical protein
LRGNENENNYEKLIELKLPYKNWKNVSTSYDGTIMSTEGKKIK